jgi:hypothetical protein
VRGKNHWDRAEILAAVAVFLTAVAILVAVYLPEIRLVLHLDKRPVTPTVAAVTPAAPVETKPELSPKSQQRRQAMPSTVDNHRVNNVSGSSNVVGNTVNGNGNVVGSNNHVQIVTPPVDTLSATVNHPLPDVGLRFVYPQSPAPIIVNPSNALARDIKWAVVLWNIDLPERNDPLPIPSSTFDWVKPHDEGGPQNIFGSSLVAPLIKNGDRLFGSAVATCPDCSRGRTYAVYIVWGKGGWFSEIPNETSGKLIIPANFLRGTREQYFKELDAMIPESSRIPIGQNAPAPTQ